MTLSIVNMHKNKCNVLNFRHFHIFFSAIWLDCIENITVPTQNLSDFCHSLMDLGNDSVLNIEEHTIHVIFISRVFWLS